MKGKISQKADNIQYKIEKNQLLNPDESLDVILETKREDLRMDTIVGKIDKNNRLSIEEEKCDII